MKNYRVTLEKTNHGEITVRAPSAEAALAWVRSEVDNSWITRDSSIWNDEDYADVEVGSRAYETEGETEHRVTVEWMRDHYDITDDQIMQAIQQLVQTKHTIEQA